VNTTIEAINDSFGQRTDSVRAGDGAVLHVQSWGSGPPVILVHAWGLNGSMWDYQVPALTAAGLRCIVPDRRGHGRSQTTATGYALNDLADDLAAVIDAFDLHDAVLVGHSAGAQVVLRAVTRHDYDRIAGVVLSAPITPYLLQTPDNPHGLAEADFEALRASWLADFGTWVNDGADAYFGDATVSEPLRDATVATLIATPLPVIVETHKTLTRSDLRPDLASLSVPTTVIQGSLDASAPIEATGRPTAALVAQATMIEIEGGGHGCYLGHAAAYNNALITSVREAHRC